MDCSHFCRLIFRSLIVSCCVHYLKILLENLSFRSPVHESQCVSRLKQFRSPKIQLFLVIFPFFSAESLFGFLLHGVPWTLRKAYGFETVSLDFNDFQVPWSLMEGVLEDLEKVEKTSLGT